MSNLLIKKKADNFSFNVIDEDEEIDVPEFQQMAVFGTFTINGDINLIGDLVIRA